MNPSVTFLYVVKAGAIKAIPTGVSSAKLLKMLKWSWWVWPKNCPLMMFVNLSTIALYLALHSVFWIIITKLIKIYNTSIAVQVARRDMAHDKNGQVIIFSIQQFFSKPCKLKKLRIFYLTFKTWFRGSGLVSLISWKLRVSHVWVSNKIIFKLCCSFTVE